MEREGAARRLPEPGKGAECLSRFFKGGRRARGGGKKCTEEGNSKKKKLTDEILERKGPTGARVGAQKGIYSTNNPGAGYRKAGGEREERRGKVGRRRGKSKDFLISILCLPETEFRRTTSRPIKGTTAWEEKGGGVRRGGRQGKFRGERHQQTGGK